MLDLTCIVGRMSPVGSRMTMIVEVEIRGVLGGASSDPLGGWLAMRCLL